MSTRLEKIIYRSVLAELQVKEKKKHGFSGVIIFIQRRQIDTSNLMGCGLGKGSDCAYMQNTWIHRTFYRIF